jgi:mRNA interferase MazF
LVSKKRYVPDRGDAAWLHFNPQAGHEQAGLRPALVLSPASYNGLTGLALVCPITNRKKGYEFEVPLPKGLKVTGIVLADQIRNFDWKIRNAELICTVPASVLEEVVAKALVLIDPDE